MPKMIRITQAAEMSSESNEGEVLLINAELILRIDGTDDNYAGDSKVSMTDGSAIYVSESLSELELRINT